jgi:AcrR family transcriptional regulator
VSTAAKRGRPPKTSREEIAAAGLRLAASEGLEAVTIRRLAKEMGLAPMTLYAYAETKDEIVDLMIQTALGSFAFERDPDAGWEAQLYDAFSGLYETMRAHPVTVDLVTAPHAIATPYADAIREQLLEVMDSAGLPRQQAVYIFETLGAYIVGVVTVEAAREGRAEETVTHIKGLPRKQYPVLTRAPTAWARPIPETMVLDGLRHLITGLCADLSG